MIPFAIELARPAVQDLDGLSSDVRKALMEAVTSLREAAFPEGKARKKLRGFGFPLYRLRAGNHRILYRIDGGTITILRVIDRRDLDRSIRRLQ